MTLKKLFLPVGLVFAAIAAIIFPAAGASVYQINLGGFSMVALLAIVIFFINGYNMKLADFPREKIFVKVLGYVVLVSLLICPWLGVAAAKIFQLAPAAAIGLVVICCAPPTLSSGIVITEVSGGRVLWALVLTVALNFIAIATLPVCAGWTLDTVGDIDISAWKLFKKLIMLVLVPLIIGWLVKKGLKNKPLHPVIRYTPSTCVILTVWMTLARRHSDLMALSVSSVLIFAAAALAVHLCLLVANRFGGKALALSEDQGKAMLFVGSQKTLPVSLTVLEAIAKTSGAAIGSAVIVCVVYHFTQLVTDSIIASKMAPAGKTSS